MNLLILCFNYPPDLGAGAFRMEALVEALEAQRTPDLEVQVITTQPNRYAELQSECPAIEDFGWLKIHRIALPSHKSGMKDQAWAYKAYALGVFKIVKQNKFDLVFATSSRLMTALLGWQIARKLKTPLYLDIRDLFTDTMGNVLQDSPLRILLPMFRWLEKRCFQAANKINLVSEGFLPHLNRLAPDVPVSCHTNGIDEAFLDYDFSTPPLEATEESNCPTILYAGNIGDGQGLHRIVPQAAERLGTRASFKILGSGGKLAELKEAIENRQLDQNSISLCPPVNRQDLLEEYKQADVLFLHLNDYPAFLKVLPSKIFEYAATGKPIIAGVGGYAKDFLLTHVPQATVVEPCNVGQFVEAVEKLAIYRHMPINQTFKSDFARKNIMDAMAREILSLTADKDVLSKR